MSNINIPTQVSPFVNRSQFPALGKIRVIYIDQTANVAYYWNNTSNDYVELGAAVAVNWGDITGNLADQTDLQNALNNKVDKVTGKGLSTNDYTTTEKNKLSGIQAGAQVNVNADWNATTGDAVILNKPTIPSTGDLVPYMGATASVDLGKNDLSVRKVFLYDEVNNNFGSIHYTDGNFHIEDADGHKLFVIEGGYLQLHKTDLIQSNLWTTLLSVTRDHYLPDASGILALLSDVSAKQDTLISGINIKTFNGSSVLGSGNLTISGGVSSVTAQYPMFSTGGANPDLSMYQCDGTVDGYLGAVDYIYFANKQATLVSATNIKTINGSSILGSGNLTVGGSVTANYPLTSSGSSIGINVADEFTDGYLSSADWANFDSKQAALISGGNIKTINGSSIMGGGNLVVSSNPSVISLSATNATAVTGTIANTITSAILIPANTFTSNGIIDITGRYQKTGLVGNHNLRMYVNTSATLTGATLVANFYNGANTNVGAFRTANIFSNTINFYSINGNSSSDFGTITGATTSATFVTSVDNYIIFAIQLINIADSSVLQYHKVIKYI